VAALVIPNHIRLIEDNGGPFVRSLATPTFIRHLAILLPYLVFAGFAVAQDAPLKVAVYNVPPYGHVEPDGSIEGLSVGLWRRAAESLGREYHLVPVTQMEDILKGLERKDYDAAIGAITITPARLAGGLQLPGASFGGCGCGAPGRRAYVGIGELRVRCRGS
jgi:hypothetical protein